MNSNPSPLTAISVGEASGDLLGVHLIRAIRTRCPNTRFTGIDGERIEAEGFKNLYGQEKLAVRGFVEVIKHLPQILKIRKELVNDLLRPKLDVSINIDVPGFNLGMAEKLKQADIHTIHYISPSVWTWRRERINKVVHQVNHVLCLFPMEPQFHIDTGGKTEFVGRPVAQTMSVEADRAAARQKLGIPVDVPVFVILPGNRVSEIDYMTAVFFRTVLLLLKRYPQTQFLLPVATTAACKRVSEILTQPEFATFPITLTDKQSDTVCTVVDMVLVTSGTAALKVALCKRPMVISYKISPLTYAYVKSKIKAPHVSLPSVPLGKAAAPGLLQYDAVPKKLTQAVADWYDHPEAVTMLEQDFRVLHLLLRRDTAALTAVAVLEGAGFSNSLEDK